MPSRKVLIGAGVVLALFTMLLSPLFNEPKELLSSYSYVPSGHRAFFELASELRPNVKRWHRTPLALTDDSIDGEAHRALLLIEPKDTLLGEGAAYQKALLDWVRAGNDLVIVPRTDDVTVSQMVGISFETHLPSDAESDGLALLLESADFEARVTPGFSLWQDPIQLETYRTTDGAHLELPFVLDFTDPNDDFHTALLATDPSGAELPVAVEAALGDGHLVILLAPGLVANMGIPRGDNAHVLLELLAEYGPDGLLVDEFYHGLPSIDGLRELLLTPPFLWVTLSFLLLAGLVTWRSLIRSEPIAEPPPPARRSKREHIDAMGRFISSSHDEKWLTSRLLEGVAAEVKATLRLDPSADLPTTIDFLRRSDEALAERYRALLFESSKLANTRASEAAAIEWGRKLHAFLRDLHSPMEHRVKSSDSHAPHS